MKVRIEATPEEIEEKRFKLVKAVAGSQYKVSLAPIAKAPFYEAQKEMLDFWEAKYDEMIENILKDIDEVL